MELCSVVVCFQRAVSTIVSGLVQWRHQRSRRCPLATMTSIFCARSTASTRRSRWDTRASARTAWERRRGRHASRCPGDTAAFGRTRHPARRGQGRRHSDDRAPSSRVKRRLRRWRSTAAPSTCPTSIRSRISTALARCRRRRFGCAASRRTWRRPPYAATHRRLRSRSISSCTPDNTTNPSTRSLPRTWTVEPRSRARRHRTAMRW